MRKGSAYTIRIRIFCFLYSPIYVNHLFLRWGKACSIPLLSFLQFVYRFSLAVYTFLCFLDLDTALSSRFLLLSVFPPPWSCHQESSFKKVSSLLVHSLRAAIHSLSRVYSIVDNGLIASFGMVHPTICLSATPLILR